VPATANSSNSARVRALAIARCLPADGCSLAEAQRYTAWLARHHYENFRVASWLLPRRFHQAFYDVYSYCRWSDDLGDEVGDASASLALLDWWEEELDLALAHKPHHPVFVALARTIADYQLPDQPFRNLLKAFRQDQTVPRYPDWGSLLGYCEYSANPVGRIVLALGGYRDAERIRLSDFTCTALQLVNFWQDVARDYAKNRIYIPLDIMSNYKLNEEDIAAGRFDSRYREMMRHLVSRTRELFIQGLPLAGRVSPEWRIDIELFSRGGMAVIDAIEAAGYDTLTRRPVVRRSTQMRLLGRALAGRWLGRGAGGSEQAA
jgi:squalene synthase HpnC